MKIFYKKIFLLFLLANIFNSAHAQKYWGAVYINKQVGITGASWNWHNKQSAMNEAKKHCMKNSKGKSGECEIAGGGGFANGCFSIYWSSATKNYGWGFDGMYTQNAQARAAKACRQKSQSGCKEIRTFCTTRFY